MNLFDQRINKAVVDDPNSYIVKGISGASGNCWWRAAWLSALIQHSRTPKQAKHLEALLIHKLGAEHTDDIKDITHMIDAIRENRFQSVLTHANKMNIPADMAEQSRLMLPGETNIDENTRGEEVCQRLTAALLAPAEVPEELRLQRLQSIYGKEPGDEMLTAALCQELAVDMVLYSKPWPHMTNKVQEVWICPQKNSRLNILEVETNDPSSLTQELLNKIHDGYIPIVITQGTHYNLSVPADLVTQSGYPT